MQADEPELTAGATVRRSDRQVSCRIDDETVLMHLETGLYFGYDPVGSRVWELLEQPITVGALCDRLVAEYAGVNAAQCRTDVVAFLRELVAEGLAAVDAPRSASS